MQQSNNRRNNNQNNYFANEIKRNGESFLDFKNANQMKMDAIRLFRDFARGKINIAEHGHYLLNNQFLESCIQACQDKLELHSISYSGVALLVQSTSPQALDPAVSSVMDFHKRSAEAYSIIMNTLQSIKVTRDVNQLVVMVNNLYNYSKII